MSQRILLIIIAMFTLSAFADDKTYYLDRQNGEMLKYRDDQAVLNLNVQAKHTDNYLHQKNDAASTTYYEFAPNLKAQYHNDVQMLQFGLWATARKINEFSEDDTTDSYSLLKYHHKLTPNQSVVISGAHFDHYLERGTGLSKGQGTVLAERDHRKSNFINAAYQLGTEDSNATLFTVLGRRNTSYKNRLEATRGLNLSANYFVLDFQYLLSGRSYLTSNLAYEDVNHDFSVQQDRQVTSALFGIKWHKTDYTHFDLSLGTVNVNFERGNLESKQDFKWDFKFRWSPIEQIEIATFTYRSIDENRRIENSYLITDKLGLNFTYRFTEDVEFYFQNIFDKLEYYFETGNEDERIFTSDLTIYYKFRRNMSWSLSLKHQRLDSVVEENDFKRNTISLGYSFVI